MQTEFDHQVKLTQYRVPDLADKPDEGAPLARKKGGKKKKAVDE